MYIYIYIYILVGGLEHEWIMTFPKNGKFIIPTDEVIFFRGVETTNQIYNDTYSLYRVYFQAEPRDRNYDIDLTRLAD
jgi:hypothetical protein